MGKKMNSSLDILKRRFNIFKAFKLEGILKSESSDHIKTKNLKRNKSDPTEMKKLKEIDYLKGNPDYKRGSIEKDENGQVKLVSPFGNYCGKYNVYLNFFKLKCKRLFIFMDILRF